MTIRAALLFLALTALCSCTPAHQDVLVLDPTTMQECPAPTRPELPGLDPGLPLDHPQNVEALMLRDDTARDYIKGLEAALRCYQEQVCHD